MDEDTVIDIEEVADVGEPQEEFYEPIDEEDEVQVETEIIDYSQTLADIKKNRISIPYLTKYERTQLISTRAQQLSQGAVPLVSVQGLKNVVDIAEKELELRKIPLIIRRRLPNKKYEDWRIDELIIN